MFNLSGVKNQPGVYLMLDLDGEAVYAGKARKVRDRLVQHFVRQSSNVVADGLLDLYEVRSVAVWYRIIRRPLEDEVVEDVGLMEPLPVLEAAVIRQFAPRWNRKKVAWSGPVPDLRLIEPYRIEVIDSPEEVTSRQRPLQRIETRLLHMLKTLRKARISGASPMVWRALAMHAQEVADTCDKRSRSRT